jgi:hypothetical protein
MWITLEENGTMPNLPSKGSLERGPASDLWRNTLSQIPSVFGRLVYLSSLRSVNSGLYEHHGLSLVFGPRAANEALRSSHEEAFREWLTYDLRGQKVDLELYLSGLVSQRAAVVETWLRLNPYRNVVPLAAGKAEQDLFLMDFKAVLELLRLDCGVSVPDRGA